MGKRHQPRLPRDRRALLLSPDGSVTEAGRNCIPYSAGETASASPKGGEAVAFGIGVRAWERIRAVCALPTDQKIVESGIFFKKGLTKSDSCGILYESDKNGVWHSLVVRLVRDQEAAGSSPVTPTIKSLDFSHSN